ncbi:MAG: transketolase, partial [Chloroflexi bacterium]|nr:transketolase [Chloroflexota bacterium]
MVAIVDVNGMGQSGPTMLEHDVDAYRRRFTAFGWRARTVDGHDMAAVLAALRWARGGREAPSAVIARTVKGKGIEGIEGEAGWHGKPLPADAAERAVAALERRLHHVPPPPVQRPRGKTVRLPAPFEGAAWPSAPVA